MKGICPICERVTDLTFVNRTEDVDIRGERISVEVEFYTCAECGGEFEDPKSPLDSLDLAYREYRRRHGMVQPEAIREFRTRYGLTQQELARLLGWGGATLSRYENGALQDDAHDRVLKLTMEPRVLMRLVREHPHTLDHDRVAELVSVLESDISANGPTLTTFCAGRFGTYEPSVYSGNRSLDLPKLFNAVQFFCTGDEVPKTKANKLLFYADFAHHQAYGTSITGARYVHHYYGPVPENFGLYFEIMASDTGALQIEEREYPDCAGEVLIATRPPDVSAFTTSELKVLATVKEYFSRSTANAISEQSHDEVGYRETEQGDLISYAYSEGLSVGSMSGR